jgi:nitroreductase
MAGANAPIRLIYVVDIDRFKNAGFQEPGLYNTEIQKSYYFVDTGLIAQNVYLAASSLGLATWFHNCNKAELTKVFKIESKSTSTFRTLGRIC